MDTLIPLIRLIKKGEIKDNIEGIKVYERSFVIVNTDHLVMVELGNQKKILVVGDGLIFNEMEGEVVEEEGKVCELSHKNRLVLNKFIAYTKPKAFGNNQATIGLGDRLGLASPGHIETVKGKGIKPILAQQSIRELNLLNRKMEDVLDAASFAVFQEGFKDGYGADGDHLKNEPDIKNILSLGVSMITLDCSDYINNEVSNYSDKEIVSEYSKLPENVRESYELKYLHNSFEVNGSIIDYDKIALMKSVLIYKEALIFIIHVYNKYIITHKSPIDFEISIDETKTVTAPSDHFFVANELHLNKIKISSLAPKFCGEFQKGIDYIGNVNQLQDELKIHASIAEKFRYKLSIHSGSDKFEIFPLIAKYTKGVFHLKTAGTNWLEAIRVIAKYSPKLYRKMHQYALDNFDHALKYYNVTPELESISNLDSTTDEDLHKFMDNNAARQVFHITYGILLSAKDSNGEFLFKDKFFQTLKEHESKYREALVTHIGKHISLLGF